MVKISCFIQGSLSKITKWSVSNLLSVCCMNRIKTFAIIVDFGLEEISKCTSKMFIDALEMICKVCVMKQLVVLHY